MSEYIAREALEAALNHRLSYLIEQYSVFDQYTTGYSDAVFAVEDFASVDAAPIVRCQDCKNFRRNNENDPYCADRRGLSDPEPDGYCSYGERREE